MSTTGAGLGNVRGVPAATTPPTTRGRRAARPSGEDRERAILATAEQLLAEVGDAFSVDDLARGAGLSRPTFYFYSASKEAVVLTLLDRVITEANRTTPTLDLAGDPVGSWRAIIQNIVDVFSAHRAVVAAAMRAQAASAELRELWATTMQRWVTQCAELIEAERVRGAAPAGRRARDIAVAPNLMNERVLASAFTGEQPSIAEADVTDVLLGIWLPAVYGTATPTPTPGR